VAAYFVPSTDPHQSEYLPDCWQRRRWLSGFSGSAGDLVVTRETAGLWTDGRYFIQAARELEGSTIDLFRVGEPDVPTIPQWLGRTLKKGQRLGVDPRVLSREMAEQLELAGVKLKLIDENLVDRLWRDRPPMPKDRLELLGTRFAGETSASKIKRLRREMRERRAQAHVLTSLDCIAWLFNIRGRDVLYNPVVIAQALITPDQAVLFVDPEKLNDRVRRALSKVARLKPYDAFGKALQRLKRKSRVWVDGPTVNLWVLEQLGHCRVSFARSPVWSMKAMKNPIELAGMRRAHLRDGAALVTFLQRLEQALERGAAITERDAARMLAECRQGGEHYRGESFETIAAYAAHGAIVHYAASESSDARLKRRGLFLLDSGAQYLDGTTDVTRTLLLGPRPTRAQREHFTRVLKGHIALAEVRFPRGTAGRQLDALARRPLWQAGLDYAHGTGHGVGHYLNVHEGPQAISPTRCTGAALEEGNVLSNEPGFYLEGGYGIRIENLMQVIKDEEHSRNGRPFFRFEILTLCPIDRRLIDPALLTDGERQWVNRYHRQVQQTLRPLLSSDAARWLRQAAKPV
jgi:Xaa-Pro aminopeptidase